MNNFIPDICRMLIGVSAAFFIPGCSTTHARNTANAAISDPVTASPKNKDNPPYDAKGQAIIEALSDAADSTYSVIGDGPAPAADDDAGSVPDSDVYKARTPSRRIADNPPIRAIYGITTPEDLQIR